MKRFAVAAAVVGIGTASCSGSHGMSAMTPAGTQGSGSGTQAQSGTRSTRGLVQTTPPAGWANTATQVFSLPNATDLGVLPATRALTVRLGLQIHNVDALKSAVESGTKLSSTQINQDGPTADDVTAVSTYLTSKGLTNVTVDPNRLLVSANGTAAQVSAAFDTTLHKFTQNGVSAYTNTTPAYVPTALGGIVVAVLGLNNVPTFAATPHLLGHSVAGPGVAAVPAGGMQTNATGPAVPTPQPESPCNLGSISLVGLPTPEPEPSPVASNVGCLRNFTPSDYWRAYDANTTPPAAGIQIAVMAEGNVAPAISDFRVNEEYDALRQVPVTVEQVGVASSDTSGDDEWTLDMTASTGMAQNVNTLYVYATTSLTDSDIALEYNRWVTDDLAAIGNSSFGGCEYGPYVDGSMLVDDEILLEGAAQGQTMFASSGDTGSFCSVGTPNGVPAGVPLVEYPAASPYVIGVGGTTLDTYQPGGYRGEVPWYSGGGGISQFEYSPVWQNGVQPGNNSNVPATFRGVPDVAMDADLQTGMVLYTTSTGWTVIGGTSLASPLAAGVWARMLRSHPAIGYAPPRLYHVYATTSAGATSTKFPPTGTHGPFHDMVEGSNGAYTALPGFDYTTGMGSFDIDALNAVIAN